MRFDSWARGPGAGLAALLLTVLTLLCYLGSLHASFQFDDYNVIVHEKRVHSLAAWWHSMPGIRPLSKFSFALNNGLSRSVEVFRATNWLIHLCATLLVATLFAQFARRLSWSTAAARWAALWVGAVFAAHPVQTEAVTYIAGRYTSLSALFVLASLVLWLRALDGGGRARLLQTLSLASFACALMAKETAVVLPLVLALFVVTGVASRSAWRATMPHWLLAALALAIILSWPPYRHLIITSLGIRSMLDNLVTQAHALGFLGSQLVQLDQLNADPRLPVRSAAISSDLLRFILVAIACIGAFVATRRRPALFLGLIWIALWLAPTNTLLARLEVANDRQWYLALAGLAWLVACAGHALLQWRTSLRMLAAPLAVALIAVLAVATSQRNRVYETEIGFWNDVVAKSPHNARAANNLGYVLALACRDTEAEASLVRSVALDPADTKSRVNLRLLRERALFPAGRPCDG